MISKVHITSDFEKSFRKLPTIIQTAAKKKDKIFRSNPYSQLLRTHKLRGELKGYWAYSINCQYRILFRFIKYDEVIYYDIGTHEIYR